MDLYRERISVQGLHENAVYPGISDVPIAMQAEGFALYVATSKPSVYAKRIVEHFDLSRLFTGIFGPELDGTRSEKAAIIAYLIDVQKLDPARARIALNKNMRLNPNIDRTFVEWAAPYKDPDDLEQLVEGLQMAGWED